MVADVAGLFKPLNTEFAEIALRDGLHFWSLSEYSAYSTVNAQSSRRAPYAGKQNRAKQSGDDREARGIFEFGTTVGLCGFPASVCTQPKPKSCGQSKNNFNMLARNSKCLLNVVKHQTRPVSINKIR